jgi:hypothetical protein
MKKALILIAVLMSPVASAEVLTSPDLKKDAVAAGLVSRDGLCHGPVTLLVAAKAVRPLADQISPLTRSPVVVLAGTSSLMVEADAGLLQRLRASPEIRSLHRIGKAPQPAGMDGLRTRADQPGGVPVIAQLAVDLPDGTDDGTRRAAIAKVRGEVLATLAPFAPINVKSYDVSPMVALTVDRRGVEALLASSAVCSVSEDATTLPLMGGPAVRQ